MSGEDMICPATMCPYMGAEDGSPWAGEQEGDCHTDCGWWGGQACIAGSDLVGMVLQEYGEPPDEQPPPCQWEDRCQWEQQAGENTCPPRMLFMHGKSPTDALF